MAIAKTKSKAEQLKQIQALLSTATNSRQRVMYEGMLSKLKSQIKEEEEAAEKLSQSEVEVKAKVELKPLGIVHPKVVAQKKPQTSDNQKVKNKSVSSGQNFRGEDPQTVSSDPLVHDDKTLVEKRTVKKDSSAQSQSIKSGNKALDRAPKVIKDSDVASQSLATEKKKHKKAGSDSLESSAEVVEKSVVPELRFLAKGVLEGEISLVERGLAIAIDGQQYPLGYTFISKQRDYRKLQSELSSGSSASLLKRVSVYPEVKLVDNTYIYFFNLVAVAKEIEQGIFAQLKPGEFYLSGLWQHVEFHPAPCLSIYRNVTDNFLGIAAKQPLGRVKSWLKPIHVPVEGLDLTKAFKYNPQAPKNQQKRRKFYTLSVIFRDSKFVVNESSISEYSKIPKYVKASQAEEILAQNQS